MHVPLKVQEIEKKSSSLNLDVELIHHFIITAVSHGRKTVLISGTGLDDLGLRVCKLGENFHGNFLLPAALATAVSMGFAEKQFHF